MEQCLGKNAWMMNILTGRVIANPRCRPEPDVSPKSSSPHRIPGLNNWHVVLVAFLGVVALISYNSCNALRPINILPIYDPTTQGAMESIGVVLAMLTLLILKWYDPGRTGSITWLRINDAGSTMKWDLNELHISRMFMSPFITLYALC